MLLARRPADATCTVLLPAFAQTFTILLTSQSALKFRCARPRPCCHTPRTIPASRWGGARHTPPENASSLAPNPNAAQLSAAAASRYYRKPLQRRLPNPRPHSSTQRQRSVRAHLASLAGRLAAFKPYPICTFTVLPRLFVRRHTFTILLERSANVYATPAL